MRSAFEEWFNIHRGKYIDIEIAGEIFGGRYGESPQLVYNYDIKSTEYKVYFNPTEILTITAPSSFLIGSNNELVVDKASQVSFGWHYYGRPQTPENWCTEIYNLREDGFVVHNLSGPMVNHLAPHREFFLGNHSFLKTSLNSKQK